MTEDVKRILLVAFLLLLGIVAVLAARAVMNMQTEGLVVGILFGPLLAYFLLFSGSPRELAFGGVTAKFGAAATETVRPDLGKIGPSVADLQEVGQKGFTAMEAMLANYNLSEASPIVMIIKSGDETYPRQDTLGFIEMLSRYRSFKFVVFTDENDRVIAYMPVWAVRQVLSRAALGDEFLLVVNRGNLIELFQYPHVIRDTISKMDTNASALQQMASLNLDSILVVDEGHRLKGVVERDQVINHMMLAVVKR